MDYPCVKFGVVVSAVLVLSLMQTNRQTDAQTDTDERFTPATVISVSSNNITFDSSCERRNKHTEMFLPPYFFIQSFCK